MIIFKDTAKREEICLMCHMPVPVGRLVLRHELTQNILCVLCLARIAEIE